MNYASNEELVNAVADLDVEVAPNGTGASPVLGWIYGAIVIAVA